MSVSRRRPIGIDLFAGAGGFSLGFEQAGFDVIGAVEVDPVHCATHQYNFPKTAVICKDIANVKGEEIRDQLGIGSKDIDVVFGGAPCQGFSLMGKRGLDDPRNALVGHFVRLVVELSPKYFVFENVYGLTVGKHRKFLEEFIHEFEDKSYNVIHDYRVLDAVSYGVPQHRKRLFILGCRAGEAAPEYPAAFTCKPQNGTLQIEGLKSAPTVGDAIRDLPNVDRFPSLLRTDAVRAKFGTPSLYAQYLRGGAPDPADYSYPRTFDSGLLTSSLRTVHSDETKIRFETTKHGEVEPISHFRKLDPNGVCNTLRAGTGSDRGAFTSPRPIHPFFPRCITVREAARLHSYPDWFRFHATKWHGFRQIGNSVPPLLSRAVANQIRMALGIRPTKPKKSIVLGDEALLRFGLSDAAEHCGVPSYVIAKRNRTMNGKSQSTKRAAIPEDVDSYAPLIRHIFTSHFTGKETQFEFERKEIELAAKSLGIVLPANKGDVVYSFRYRKNLPSDIAETAPRGSEWIIEGAGRGRYRFRQSRASRIVPRPNHHKIKIPDNTPEIVSAYATSDEQALLAKVRYTRLIDTFLGITTYSLQSHLRTHVKGVGQIVVDEMYVGVSQSGAQFVIPVQAKGVDDVIGVVQARQDAEFCAQQYPHLECRLVAIQAMPGQAIAMFELTLQNDDVCVREERHYMLVPAEEITKKDLEEFRRGSASR